MSKQNSTCQCLFQKKCQSLDVVFHVGDHFKEVRPSDDFLTSYLSRITQVLFVDNDFCDISDWKIHKGLLIKDQSECVLVVYIHNPVSFVVTHTKNGRLPKRSLASVSTCVHVWSLQIGPQSYINSCMLTWP